MCKFMWFPQDCILTAHEICNNNNKNFEERPHHLLVIARGGEWIHLTLTPSNTWFLRLTKSQPLNGIHKYWSHISRRGTCPSTFQSGGGGQVEPRVRALMHDGMQYDPNQGQGHEHFRVGNSAIFKSYSLGHLQWELATDHGFLN